MTIEARVRLLEDRDELTRLVANYCKGADSEDAALFASVWHEDAEWDVGSYVFRGRSQILEAVERQWQMFESMHHWTANSRFEVEGDTARGEHDVAALVVWLDGTSLLTAGRYTDRFERRADLWALTHRTAETLTTIPLPTAYNEASTRKPR